MNVDTLHEPPAQDCVTTAELREAASERLRDTWLLGQRRQFIVDRRSQFRAAAMVTVTVLLLLVMVNIALHLTRAENTAAIVARTPALEPMLAQQDRLEFGLIVTASVIFLAAVFIVTILETHKTAGAAVKLGRGLGELQEGNYGIVTVLRRGDNLRNLESELNRLSAVLYERAGRNFAELEHLADRAREISSPAEARELADRLSALADEERSRMA